MTHHPLSDCDNCPLFNDGEFLGLNYPEANYDMSVVSGAPTILDKMRSYSITKAGQLLYKVFKYHEHDPHYYHTTAVLCNPKDGKVPAKAVTACRPRLIAELEQAGSGPVLAIGSEASLSLLPQGGAVTKSRVGTAKTSPYLPNRIVPTISPYLCMRNSDKFPDLVTDIGKLWRVFETFEEPEFDILRTEDEVLWCLSGWTELAKVAGKLEVTIDIECVIDKETSFGHPEHYEMLCIGLQVNDSHLVVIAQEAITPVVWERLATLLRNSNIIAQNGKFDLNGIRPHTGKLNLWFDTMLASYALDERSGIHGLKYMAQEYLNAPPYDDKVSEYIGPGYDFSKVPKAILYKYNAYDVYLTRLLKNSFTLQLLDADRMRLHDFLISVSNMLMDVEYTGITIDTDKLNELAKDYEISALWDEQHMCEMAWKINPKGYEKDGDGINPRSSKQVKQFLADMGVQVDSTNESTLNEILAYDAEFPKHNDIIKPFVEKLLAYRKKNKLMSTYILGVRDRLYKGRVHSSYLIHGTTTGRLSSRNPNLQNIPRDKKSGIKDMFVPAEGMVFINADYSQAELRTISWLAGDQYFRDIFNDGHVDVFDELVPVLFTGASKTNHDNCSCGVCALWKERRTMVKTYVYGLNYGRSAYGIAAGFGISEATAKKHMAAFFSVIPEIVDWQKEIRATVMRGDSLVTPFGRHRNYSLLTEENLKKIMNEALAFIPQSTASDICLGAAVDFSNDSKGGRIFNLVHDSIMVECLPQDVDNVKARLEECMLGSAERTVGDYVKFATDMSVGNSWGELS